MSSILTSTEDGILMTTDIIEQLDTLISLSEAVLTAAEETQWDEFLRLEKQRQDHFEAIKAIRLPEEKSVIERIEMLLAMNKTILNRSVDYQSHLQVDLKKQRNQHSASQAYKDVE